MLIRPELPPDWDAIDRLHRAAFPGPLEARLVAELREAGRLSISLVAEQAGEIVGHVAFSPVTIAGHSDLIGGLGLAPLAVIPAKQRRGIGSQLVQEGLSSCTLGSASFVVVLGEPNFYGRFGFRPATEWGLANEYGAGHEFMAIELEPDVLVNRQGCVRYAPEFVMFGE